MELIKRPRRLRGSANLRKMVRETRMDTVSYTHLWRIKGLACLTSSMILAWFSLFISVYLLTRVKKISTICMA